jgi:hypothetical protein
VHAKFSRSAKIDANAEHHATAKNENDGIAPPFPRLHWRHFARNINSLNAASAMRLVVRFEQNAANTQFTFYIGPPWKELQVQYRTPA